MARLNDAAKKAVRAQLPDLQQLAGTSSSEDGEHGDETTREQVTGDAV